MSALLHELQVWLEESLQLLHEQQLDRKLDEKLGLLLLLEMQL